MSRYFPRPWWPWIYGAIAFEHLQVGFLSVGERGFDQIWLDVGEEPAVFADAVDGGERPKAFPKLHH